jgi:sRNA-binding protein
MRKKYDNVALELGVGPTIRSASTFRSPPEKAATEMEDMEKTAVDDMPKATARVEATKQDAKEETKPTNVTTWTSLALVQFLKNHWDTHALSTTFFSLSSKDSIRVSLF